MGYGGKIQKVFSCGFLYQKFMFCICFLAVLFTVHMSYIHANCSPKIISMRQIVYCIVEMLLLGLFESAAHYIWVTFF